MPRTHRSSFLRRLIVAASILSVIFLNFAGITPPALAQGDTAPTVIETDPVDGATNVPVNTTIFIVTFSEAVTYDQNSNTAFTLTCNSTPISVSATDFGDSEVALVTTDTELSLPFGASCTFTVVASFVNDVDTNDPPDTMASNYVVNFTTVADNAPSVISTTPANNATNVNVAANLSATFSEAVTQTNGFTLTCNGTPQPFAVTGGPTTFTINPNANLPEGASCVFTVVASGIADNDTQDPPDNPASNTVVNFTTTPPSDSAPTVSSTTPANNATGVSISADLSVTFSEAVTQNSAFTLTCNSIAQPFAVSGGPTTFTINPNADLPASTACVFTVLAAGITDNDVIDPPNNMFSDVVVNFTTGAAPDTAPAVSSTVPSPLATNVSVAANLTVTFNEAVTQTSAFTLTCNSVNQPFAISGGPTTFTINPNANLPTFTACVLTVLASGIADDDANDPPNNMAANYVLNFTTGGVPGEFAPNLLSSVPANNATNVALNSVFTLTFNEAVTLTNAIEFSCNTAQTVPTLTITGGPTVYTLTPSGPLPTNVTCALEVLAAGVADNDTNDPPNTMAFNKYIGFTTADTAPAVKLTVPANNETGWKPDGRLFVQFTESVTLNSAFTLTCNSIAQPFTVDATGPFVDIFPTNPLPNSASCVLTILAAGVADNDTNDPPNNMAANVVVNFTVEDAAATIVSSTPTNNATNVSVSADLSLTFSEAVTLELNAFTLKCGAGSLSYEVTGGPTTFTINPNNDLPASTACTLDIPYYKVTDNDTQDPPDYLEDTVRISFTTGADAAPSVLSSLPANNATGYPVADNLTVTFSEGVAQANGFTLTCNSVAQPFAVTNSGAVFTINPTNNLPGGQNCVLTVVAANISDTDVNDPPNNMAANVVVNFSTASTTDAAPSVVSTTPAQLTQDVALNADVTFTFSEAVTLGSSPVSFFCSSVTVAYTVTGGPTTFTINPTVDLPANAFCGIALDPNKVSDVDTNDPPNNMTGSYYLYFTTEAPPGITSTFPLDGDVNIAPNANLSVSFSELVGLTNAISLTCNGTTQAITVTAYSNTTFTVNPNVDMPAGANCAMKITGTGVSDRDLNDPPDNMAYNLTINFTTTDKAPAIVTTAPANNGANFSVAGNLSVTFDEPVTLTATPFDLKCNNVAVAYTVTGGPTTFTIDPTGTLPANTACFIDYLAANIADSDVNDPPNNLTQTVRINFTTGGDAAPTVISSVPANNGTGFPISGDLTVTFDEPVTQTNAFTLTCNSVNQPVTVTASNPTFTINPNNNLPTGANCVLTVVAANIADNDTQDPPNNMAANVVINFSTAATTDAAPAVTATTPNNLANGVSSTANVTLTFSEGVTLGAGAVSLLCNGTPVTFAVSGGPTAFTVDPDLDLPAGATCVVAINRLQVTDTDTEDDPDNMVSDFTSVFFTDAAPTVTTTTPAQSATNVAVSANLSVTFSEAVTQTSAFSVTCDEVSQPITVTGGPTTFTLDPNSDLPSGANCVLTVSAAGIADNDVNDPADNMLADTVIYFSTTGAELAPTVVSTTPTDDSANFPVGNNLTVTFSEAVTAASGAFTLTCANVAVSVTVTGGPTVFTINPNADLRAYAACRLTVDSTLITDNDIQDPPDNLPANVSVDFSTAKADTVGVFRPSNEIAYLRFSNSGGPVNLSFAFSSFAVGDIIVRGDWNGDGVTTLGIFRPSNNTWYLFNSNAANPPVAVQFAFGIVGDIPVVGDWDGNGTDTIGVFRPSQKKFYLRNTNTAGPVNLTVNFGLAGDRPVAGDWDNNGTDTPGVWRPSNRIFYLTNANSGNGVIAFTIPFGLANDIPLAGDWNGDGRDSVGVFRPTAKVFYLRQEVNNAAILSVPFGLTTDTPITGVWQAIPAFPPSADQEVAPSFVPKQ